jgi:hypothetical protein
MLNYVSNNFLRPWHKSSYGESHSTDDSSVRTAGKHKFPVRYQILTLKKLILWYVNVVSHFLFEMELDTVHGNNISLLYGGNVLE